MSDAPGTTVASDGAAAPVKPVSLLVALGLTVVIPGAGHAYSGKWRAGAIWCLLAAAGYAWRFWPGAIVHALCLVSLLAPRRP